MDEHTDRPKFYKRWWWRFQKEKATEQALFLIGAIGIIGTFLLVIIGFNQLGAQRDTLEKQIATSRKQLRPYVKITILTDSLPRWPDGVTKISPNDTIEYLVRVVGQTPAYNVRVVTEYAALDSIEHDPANFDSSGAHAQPMLTDELFKTADILERITRASNPRLIFSGKITYDDTFGEPHMMTFCYIYYTSQDKFYPNPARYNREYY